MQLRVNSIGFLIESVKQLATNGTTETLYERLIRLNQMRNDSNKRRNDS